MNTEIQKFLRLISPIANYGRIQRAIKMLKKESFTSFLKKSEGGIYGIIKSQTNKELIYSSSIDKFAGYFCGTQNIRPCGGLRGSVCKHIILLLMAGIKDGLISAEEAADIVRSTEYKKPNYNKEHAKEIIILYQNAVDGTIEWRAVEILPEDLMAF